MTWRPPWWVAPVAVLVAVLAVVWALNRGRDAQRELAREREERALEVAGLNVAHQVDRDALMQDLIGEATANAKLAEELARIQAATPGARPIATAHGSTPWTTVGPAAGSAPPPPPAGGMDVPPPVPAPPGVPGVPGGTCPPCRLWVGDEVQVRAGGAALETDAGNYVVAAAAAVWRRPGGGGPEEKLHDERLRLKVQIEDRAAAPPGWGAGVLATAGREGWAVGPAASPPPLRVWGLEGSLTAGLAFGPGGTWTAAGLALLRW